jgi:hypothetical protein
MPFIEDVFVKNEEERRLYELREKSRLRLGNALHTAEHRGRQEGIHAIVRSMLARDMPLALISEISGLSVEEIEALRKALVGDKD